MTTPNRRAAGTPSGGQFAASPRAEADVNLNSGIGTGIGDAPDLYDIASPLSAEDASTEAATTAPTADQALANANVRPFVKTLGPAIALRSLVDDEEDVDTVRHLVPNLSPNEVRTGMREIAEALEKSEKYRDPVEAEEAPSGDQLVDLDEFATWESDRIGEDPMAGYDFDAYADAMSDAWDQCSVDKAKAMVALNDSRASRAS